LNELGIVGKSYPRAEGKNKVLGKEVYTGDLKFPGMLMGKVLRSPYARAKVLNIDVSKAARLAGVKAIVTGEDFRFMYGFMVRDRPYYCWDEVRYIGDSVAGVAAIDEDTAEEAISLIKVDYEELTPVLDVVRAMEPGSPLVHAEIMRYWRASSVDPVKGTNICDYVKIRKGNIDKGFGEADYVFEDTFSTPAVQHCSLEPHVSIAQVDPSGKITIWTSQQHPYKTRAELADSLGIPDHKVRIIVPAVGGAFGGKIWMKTEALSVPLAMKVKDFRPVRVTLSREEEFYTVVKHPLLLRIKTGVKKDGRIVARKAELIFDTGAYADIGPFVSRWGAIASSGAYEIPNIWTDSYLVYTNKMISGAWRSLGTSQTIWGVECHMDSIADKLGIDPIEFRLKNVLKEGSSTTMGERLNKVGIEECLLKVKEGIGWGKKGVAGRGKGVALTLHLAGRPSVSSAVVKVNDNGTANVLTSAVDLGQGSETILRQIAAEALGFKVENIQICRADTDVTPYDIGVSASRSTFTAGNAVRLAALDARQQLIRIASEKLEVKADDLEIREGAVVVRGFEDEEIPVGRLPMGLEGGKPILGVGSFTTDEKEKHIPMDPLTGQSPNSAHFWLFAAQGVELEVERETGKIKILKVVSAHDVGKAINPLNCEQQIEGAIGMGIGISLMEEVKTEDGRIKNPNLVDYKMPTAKDMPEMVPIIVEVPEEKGPFHARGLGEPAVAPTPPAVANAVFNAIGIRIKDMPITPDKILRELKRKEGA
jgi:CO/xanthine dehydrogenase Mo-binding subunit